MFVAATWVDRLERRRCSCIVTEVRVQRWFGRQLGEGLRARSHRQALLRGHSCLERGEEGEVRVKEILLAAVTALPGLRRSM